MADTRFPGMSACTDCIHSVHSSAGTGTWECLARSYQNFGSRMHSGELNGCLSFESTYTETNHANTPLCIDCILGTLHPTFRPLWKCEPHGDRWHSARCACSHFIDQGFTGDLPRTDWPERWEHEHLRALRTPLVAPSSPGIGVVWKCATCIHRRSQNWSRWSCNITKEWSAWQDTERCPEYVLQPVPGGKDSLLGAVQDVRCGVCMNDPSLTFTVCDYVQSNRTATDYWMCAGFRHRQIKCGSCFRWSPDKKCAFTGTVRLRGDHACWNNWKGPDHLQNKEKPKPLKLRTIVRL